MTPRTLKTACISAANVFGLWSATTTTATAQDAYLGTLHVTAGTYCPSGTVPAEGQVLTIASNTSLFAVVGTTYGGDGTTTFALPDLRGRGPIHYGAGPGLNTYPLGESGGEETINLSVNELPPHSHMVNATNQTANKNGPGTDFLAIPNAERIGEIDMYHEGPPNKQMDPGVIAETGEGQPLPHRSPYVAMMWCVTVVGQFPPKS